MKLRGDHDRTCKRGHDLTDPKHRYVTPDRLVECRTCNAIITKRYYERREQLTGNKYKPLYLAESP